ncbi:uncharacterized protein LOC126418952 isoform X8 [Schistocerca serialis cubense]|uniref:uncharacterized protein LOC126418952 isoform X7 n=1 Tax=Schistocerca serialis cubense TaxID=2023355 RepID=UPI00214E2DD3|nr:uncharacterized protein LOC126418952 isoform X7 [Schistocerca serialis cubense]XP_049941952.1 uncharacterized protein LOC126418952 isoform X8 [Schistocerca serialis cubense]
MDSTGGDVGATLSGEICIKEEPISADTCGRPSEETELNNTKEETVIPADICGRPSEETEQNNTKEETVKMEIPEVLTIRDFKLHVKRKVGAKNEAKRVDLVRPVQSRSHLTPKKRKLEERYSLEEAAYEIIRREYARVKSDEYSHFGRLIAQKLRRLKSERLKKVAQVELLRKLLEIEREDMEEDNR